MEICAFLGCSRGLGAEVLRHFAEKHPKDRGIGLSRDIEALTEVRDSLAMTLKVEQFDFSNENDVAQIVPFLAQHSVNRVFYFAGGGPYGLYKSKKWRDHNWAWKVNFLTPAYLLHSFLRDDKFSYLKQVVFVGSAIADDRPDPLAASYSSAKHALRGLIETVIQENPVCDIRLFRPGYMDTALLPKNAKPRQATNLILNPVMLAQEFVEWVDDKNGDKVYTVTP